MFQSLSGLTLGLNIAFTRRKWDCGMVSIPFRADTGFELETPDGVNRAFTTFQSLSGLTLGLNSNLANDGVKLLRFNPFQG